jgi:hypothetical protein
MELNFQKYTLHLQPLPEQPPSPQGYDREVPANETDFTPIFRFGHELCLLTRVNQGVQGLFLLDTGATTSVIDTTFARLSTKLEKNDLIRMRGVSGDVKDVFVTGHANLQFARFTQDNVALPAVNLNTFPEHQETRLSGLIGFPVLYLFRLQLDYRNGLVKFDYIFEKNAKKKKSNG